MAARYLFIFGRTPALSLAELKGYLEGRQLDLAPTLIAPDVALVGGLPPGLAAAAQRDLAGVVKVAAEVASWPAPETLARWAERLAPLLATDGRRGLVFGLSFLGQPRHCPRPAMQERIALTAKRARRALQPHVRWVNGRGQPLSSVQVEKNGLLAAGGLELVAVCRAGTVTVGRTISVQAFESWGERDYGRPRRNAKQGMLPPKLARMMVNLLGLPPRGLLLDPFCGSGTVLAEAALLGWRELVGTDRNIRAVQDTVENLRWLEERARTGAKFTVWPASVAELPAKLRRGAVRAIVTEPFLGPPLSRPADEAGVAAIEQRLLPLYREALEAAADLLAPGGRAVFVAPGWQRPDGGERSFSVSRHPLPQELRWLPRSLPSQPLRYHRPGQSVTREILAVERR